MKRDREICEDENEAEPQHNRDKMCVIDKPRRIRASGRDYCSSWHCDFIFSDSTDLRPSI